MGLLATIVIFAICGAVALGITRIVTDAVAKDGAGKRESAAEQRTSEREERDARRS